MSKLVCEVVTPSTRLFYEHVYMVVAPGVEGEMGFLEDHVPLLSILADGTIRIQKEKDGELTQFVVQGGGLEVTGKKVIILADRAILVDKIDANAVNDELTSLEQKFNSMGEEEAKAVAPTIGYDIDWCKLQLRAISK